MFDCNSTLFGDESKTILATEDTMAIVGWWHVTTIGSEEGNAPGVVQRKESYAT